MEQKPRFDPDVSPDHPTNQKAASERKWTFSQRRGAYLDEDGCMVADRYGQTF